MTSRCTHEDHRQNFEQLLFKFKFNVDITNIISIYPLVAGLTKQKNFLVHPTFDSHFCVNNGFPLRKNIKKGILR